MLKKIKESPKSIEIILLQTGLLLIFLSVFIVLFFLIIPFIHETGHIIFGTLDGLMQGRVNKFEISNFREHPIISFIETPQQVRIWRGSSSLNFMLGGPMFTILIFLALSLFAYKISRDKRWFLLAISVFLYEVSGNIICGTDNFIGNPLSICYPLLNKVFLWTGILLFASLFSLMSIEKIWEKLRNKSF